MTYYISLLREPVCCCRPETVRDELGGDPFSYFNTNFPRLVFETYKVVTEFPEKKKLLSDFPCARKETKVLHSK